MATDDAVQRDPLADDALDRAIGRVVRAAGHTEWLLAQLYQLLIWSPHAATLVAGMSLRDLCDSVVKVADASRQPRGLSLLPGRRIDHDTLAAIRQAIATAQSLATQRNIIVHAYWGRNGWDPTEHVTLLSRGRQADPQVAYWTPTKLEELRAEYALLDRNLYRLIEQLFGMPARPLHFEG